MTDTSAPETPDISNEKISDDTTFYYVIIGMLVVMMMAMAGLWLVQRGKTNRAIATNVKILKDAHDQQAKFQKSFQGFANGMWVQRETLGSRERMIDGQKCTVMEMDPATAKLMGLQAGDWLWVNPALTPKSLAASFPETVSFSTPATVSPTTNPAAVKVD